MDGRSFLVLGASGVALAATDCAPALPIVQAAPPSTSPKPAAAPHAELEEASVGDLVARMAKGALTSRDLVAGYLARIDAIDRAGPTLRSILETNPDALAIASKLDEERRAKGPRGPLHGIPIVVKDNIDTSDRMQTTAGSLALLGHPTPKDAPLVAKLRAAGAVILAKTNLSEWANIRSTRSTSGWSARGGFTKNCYALDRNPSGSSSGSASSIAASLATVAIGSETDGSIMSPSMNHALVGIKPTVGLVSQQGIIPISHSQDTAGPMARTVTDAAIVLGVMADADYTKSLMEGGLRGKRLGAKHQRWASPAVKASFDAALDVLKRLGATIVDVEHKEPPDLEDAELDVMLFELKADLPTYLATRGGAMRTLEDVVRFNEKHAAEELAPFGQEMFEKALKKGGLDSPDYVKAKEMCRRASRDDGIDAILAGGKLDAIVAPTGGPAWLTDVINGDHFTGSSYSLAAIAGYPSLTVPCGETHGLPLGLCFFAGARSEAALVAMAFAYEQATKLRAKPTYATSATNVL